MDTVEEDVLQILTNCGCSEHAMKFAGLTTENFLLYTRDDLTRILPTDVGQEMGQKIEEEIQKAKFQNDQNEDERTVELVKSEGTQVTVKKEIVIDDNYDKGGQKNNTPSALVEEEVSLQDDDDGCSNSAAFEEKIGDEKPAPMYTVNLTDRGIWDVFATGEWEKLWIFGCPIEEGGLCQDGLPLEHIVSILTEIPHKSITIITTLSMLHRADIQKVLTQFKDSITHLVLRVVARKPPAYLVGLSSKDFPTSCISVDAFFSRLQNLPRLQHLDITSREALWTRRDKVSKSSLNLQNLISLKTLQLWSIFIDLNHDAISNNIIRKLLKLAVNLEHLDCVPLTWSTSTIIQNKLSLVRSFVYASKPLPANQENYNHFVRFMNHNVKLMRLHIIFQFPDLNDKLVVEQWTSMLRQLVHSSVDFLEHLKIQPLEYFDFINFPRLNNLKALTLVDQSPLIVKSQEQPPAVAARKSTTKKGPKMDCVKKVFKFFSPETCIEHVFPNLEGLKIAVEVPDDQPNLLNEYFPPNQFRAGHSFQKVTDLYIAKKIPVIPGVERMTLLCPNVTNFEVVCDSSSLKNILRLAWTRWPNLYTFKMRVDLDNKTEDQNLDSVITGMSESKCQRLRRTPKKFEKKANQFRKGPSVLDMKDLRIFNMEIRNARNLDKIPHLFSFVSRLYGFALMPDLQLAQTTDGNCLHAMRINKMINDWSCKKCTSLSCDGTCGKDSGDEDHP